MRFQYFEIRPCVDDGKKTTSFLGKPVFCPSRGAEIYTPENALAEAMAYLDQHGGEFFWTLYGRDEDGLAVAIGDFPHFSDAEAVMNAILAPMAAARDAIFEGQHSAAACDLEDVINQSTNRERL